MSDPSPSVCPVCGALLECDAAGGCPRCLMLAAMKPTAHSAGGPRQPPPSLEAVAAAFPQLEIIELVGQGGMGCVFKARQPKLNRLVALKLLPASLAERDAAFAGRFEREGQMLARLHHPNIVAVHDSGAADEFFYLIMEFVDGVNLRQAMHTRKFTPAQALKIVPHICDALQFAHDEGVLHRDVKPENILLDSKGRVKLADFGIAKLLADADAPATEPGPANPSLTHAGTALGTPSYMAPEQRDTPADVDHRADIYSLGVVFYELLTGELPVGKFAAPSEISASDPRVDAIVRQALEKERERRQQSAGEVRTQVETVASGPERTGGAAQPAIDSRISLTAVAGACLSVLVFAMVPTRMGFAPKFIAAFGTTLLGWIAVGQIRRSGGRLHGLALAVYDGLVFPLLAVDALIGYLLKSLGYGVLGWSQISAPTLHGQHLFAVCVISVILDLFIIRWVWRAVNRTPANASDPSGAFANPPTPVLHTVILHAMLLALVCALLLFAVPKYAEIYRDMGNAVPPVTRVVLDVVSIWGLMLLPLLLLLDVGCCFLARDFAGRAGLRRWSGFVLVAQVLVAATSFIALQLPIRRVIADSGQSAAVATSADSGEGAQIATPADSEARTMETWTYTPRYLTERRTSQWIKGSSFKHKSGVITLTGPRERMRPLATLLRALDQPEVQNPMELPILNMPPDFFLRNAFPALLQTNDFAMFHLADALHDSLKREGITAPQLARALSAHVLELEKATFVNSGTPFESIVKSPGASTFYETTIPCADQPDKPLTLRIERTTQQVGTRSKFAAFAPWLLEEAKKQSKEPLDIGRQGPAKDGAANPPAAPTNPEAKAAPQSQTDVQLGIVQKTSVAEGAERNEWRLVGVRTTKPGWLHLWTPGGERFSHQLTGNALGGENDYELRVAYRLYEGEKPVFQYWIDGLPGERRSHEIDLANRHLKFDEVAKGLREIRDPVGACIRNMPYDLAPIGDSALLLAVTDAPEPPSETPFFLHIWTPPLHTTPPQLAAGLETVVVRIGEMLVTPSESGKTEGGKRMGQRLGRISHRDGKFYASIRYDYRSTSMVDEFMTPEVPFAVRMYGFSGAIWPQFMVLTTKQDMTTFLKEEFYKAAPADAAKPPKQK